MKLNSLVKNFAWLKEKQNICPHLKLLFYCGPALNRYLFAGIFEEFKLFGEIECYSRLGSNKKLVNELRDVLLGKHYDDSMGSERFVK